jgi:hypothetical protein
VKKLLKARRVKGSGSGVIAKGDVKSNYVLVECKAALGRMPSPVAHLGKISHEAKVVNRVPNLSTARFRRRNGDLELTAILYFVPASKEDHAIDLGASIGTTVPRFWNMKSEQEYIAWLKEKRLM